MNRRPVQSSNVASLGWEDDVMEVEYRSGHLYAFKGVSEGEYQAALGASSVGKFIAGLQGKYDVQRLK
jgi:hypothetical protein